MCLSNKKPSDNQTRLCFFEPAFEIFLFYALRRVPPVILEVISMLIGIIFSSSSRRPSGELKFYSITDINSDLD